MSLKELKPRLAVWRSRVFTDREFFMRSHGEVRFLKISAQWQFRVAAFITTILALWLLFTIYTIFNQYTISSERLALVKKQAEVESSAERVAAYKDSVETVADDLEKRQEYLENLVSDYLGEQDSNALIGAVDDGDPQNAADKDDIAHKISALIPEARSLASMEDRQIAFVAALTKMAEDRSRKAETGIRKFGLNPQKLVARQNKAQGGPFLPFLSSEKDDIHDPRFIKLNEKLAQMDAMERALLAIPSGRPTFNPVITSHYGYRRDPFNGGGAMHSGIDFRGPHGAPILAAANGRVSHAGWRSGYGKCVEIDHGNGLVTRYAHLSRISVAQGQKIGKGEKLGGMGSTGRSTATHLHFEVRMNGKAINPKPFLETQKDVLKIQQIATERTRNIARKDG